MRDACYLSISGGIVVGLLRWAWTYGRPYSRGIALLATLSTAEIALRILAPFTMLVVVDHALGSGPLPAWLGALGFVERREILVVFALAGLTLQILHELVVMWHGRVAIRVGQGMVRDLRDDLFGHVQAWALQHHGATRTGEAVQRLESDTRCIDQIVLRGVFPVVFSALTLVVMFGVLLAIDLRLAVLALAVVPPLFSWLRWGSRRMVPSADHARRTDSRVTSRVIETIGAIRLIKSHARERHERARFSEIADANAHAWIDVGHQATVFAVVTAALTIVGSTLVLLVGGLGVLDGRITIGTLLLVLAYLGYVYGPLSAIANTTATMQQALASARRIRAAFEIVPEQHDALDAIGAENVRGAISFEHVTFAYPGGTPVLDEISFVARPGEMVALVGPSGSGKSTLLSLIPRLYDVASGRIGIDNVSIERYRLRELRERVAIVLQDALVIPGTVRENLLYGRPDARDADLLAAAHAAHAHDFIVQLDSGYDTELGEHGARLSGGQRQRLSIARAFLKDAPILLLDEPTAALDTLAERQIVDAIQRLRAGRTTLVVAHRLSTVRDADRILVMEHGRLIAEGAHAELVANCDLYRKLAAQFVSSPGPAGPGRWIDP